MRAVLAAGLKPVLSSGERFEPWAPLTRAEAARAPAVTVALQNSKAAAQCAAAALSFIGSASRIRTYNLPVNSRLLYR